MNSDAPPLYLTLNNSIVDLRRLCDSGNWAAVSELAKQIDTTVQSGAIGKANQADREIIEQSLQHLDACLRKAEPSRDDIARLLKGFGIDLGEK